MREGPRGSWLSSLHRANCPTRPRSTVPEPAGSSLHQLDMSDARDARETLLYRLATSTVSTTAAVGSTSAGGQGPGQEQETVELNPLHCFNTVVLIASPQVGALGNLVCKTFCNAWWPDEK